MARIVRIAVPSSGEGGLDDSVAERFGRAPVFTVVAVDVDTGEVVEVRVVRNPGAEAGSGAGVKAAQAVADAGAEVVAGPSPGPNAFVALQQLGVKVYTFTGGKVRDAVGAVLEALRRGEL